MSQNSADWSSVDDRAILNLYYRSDPAVWGQGYAKERAREAFRRGRAHILSQRTSQAAGGLPGARLAGRIP